MESLARLAKGRIESIHGLQRPFSNFQYICSHNLFRYAGPSLQRIFCESRRAGALTLVVEYLDDSEEIIDETQDLKRISNQYSRSEIRRITFWKSQHNNKRLQFSPPDNLLLGYAIVRADFFTNETSPFFHVFESVFQKYYHVHNFVPCDALFKVGFNGKHYSLSGVMYCQQNGRTKACAQVALRTLLATRLISTPIKYSEINDAAKVINPSEGLNSKQIRQVLDHYKINYRDVDYSLDSDICNNVPYSKLLYAGLENGIGGMLGFEMSGQNTDGSPVEDRHIIPFFGHTFNQDTWAPRAENAYFHIGKETRYIPSFEWLSSFIGHDDNFGSNYCVPKAFLLKECVTYALALLPNGYISDPLQAEAVAAEVLYSLFSQVPDRYHPLFWFECLSHYVNNQDVVFRTRAISREEYVSHLSNMRDWSGHSMKIFNNNIMEMLPGLLWMIELSIPEVFSTNYGKLGEILLPGDVFLSVIDNQQHENDTPYLDKVAFARFPGVAIISTRQDEQSKRNSFVDIPCDITEHVPLYGFQNYE